MAGEPANLKPSHKKDSELVLGGEVCRRQGRGWMVKTHMGRHRGMEQCDGSFY